MAGQQGHPARADRVPRRRQVALAIGGRSPVDLPSVRTKATAPGQGAPGPIPCPTTAIRSSEIETTSRTDCAKSGRTSMSPNPRSNAPSARKRTSRRWAVSPVTPNTPPARTDPSGMGNRISTYAQSTPCGWKSRSNDPSGLSARIPGRACPLKSVNRPPATNRPSGSSADAWTDTSPDQIARNPRKVSKVGSGVPSGRRRRILPMPRIWPVFAQTSSKSPVR
jgi:hypothetical protein